MKSLHQPRTPRSLSCQLRPAAALLAAFALISGASAQTTWVGNTSADINTAANWTAGVPTGSVNSIFTTAGSSGSTLSLSADLQFVGGSAPTSNAMLFNGDGFTLTGTGTRQLTIGGQGLAISTANTITLDTPRIRRNASNTFEFLGSSGDLVVNGGFSTNITAAADTTTRVDFTGAGGTGNTITFNGAIVNVFTGVAGAGLGNLITSSSGTGNRVVFNNPSNTGFTGTITVGNNVQVQLGNGGTGGTLAGSTAVTLGNAASRFTVNQSDTVTQGTEFASSITGSGGFTQAGAGTTILNAANGFSGGSIISAGTLLVENTTGSGTGTGAVTVQSGGALGGDGSISGSVTFNAGSKFAFSTTSVLDVNGATVSFGGFSVSDLNGLSGAVAAGTYTLIAGSASISATNLANVGSSNAFSLGAEKTAYFDLGTGDLQLVVAASAIPEPAAFSAVLGLGVVALAAARRRRSAV